MRMYILSIFQFLLSSAVTTTAFPRESRTLNTSPTPESNPHKYFHEASWHPHYDGRFATEPLSYIDRQKFLRGLIQTYHLFAAQIGVETWLMHGSLLGWYWNRRVMPWDSDVDVMISERGLRMLARWHNMTVHHFRFPKRWEDFEWEEGRDYLLEVNSHWWETRDVEAVNGIDARWIDMRNGLFIDITTLRERAGREDLRVAKDGHEYAVDDIFPLRVSQFEGVNVSVPFAYSKVLTDEYGPAALSDVHIAEHRFDVFKKMWVPYTWRDLKEEDDRARAGNLGTVYWADRKPRNMVKSD